MPQRTGMQVSLLSVTPIKGLALHHPEHVDVTAEGLIGDRKLFLVTDAGELISCTDLGALMQHRADYDAVSGVLSVHGPDGLLRSEPIQPGAPDQAAAMRPRADHRCRHRARVGLKQMLRRPLWRSQIRAV